MPVYALRVRHVLQHHLAHLQRRLPEADLEDLDVPALPRKKSAWASISQSTEHLEAFMYLLFDLLKVVVRDRKEALREEHLQLPHEQVLRVVDADERADHVTRLVRAEIYMHTSASIVAHSSS
jgi:hypothetical protein